MIYKTVDNGFQAFTVQLQIITIVSIPSPMSQGFFPLSPTHILSKCFLILISFLKHVSKVYTSTYTHGFDMRLPQLYLFIDLFMVVWSYTQPCSELCPVVLMGI